MTNKIIKLSALSMLYVVGSSFSSISSANSTSTSLIISANVPKTCEISASQVDMGDYDFNTGISVNLGSALQIKCSQYASYQVRINTGIWGDGVSSRYMRNMMTNDGYLRYDITTFDGRSIGNDYWNGYVNAGTGYFDPVQLNLYVPAFQQAGAGGYRDEITVSVDY